MLRAYGHFVLLESVSETSGCEIEGISHITRHARVGRVCSVGHLVTSVRENDHVLLAYCAGYDTVINDREYTLVSVHSLLAVVDDRGFPFGRVAG